MLKPYKQFRPSRFDHNIPIEDRSEWLVAPCGVNRDSDALTRSNWEAQLARLGGEAETVEVHRFGHWGPGWFEIAIIDPSDAARVKEAEEIEASIADYPVLDESDFSEKEREEADQVWANCYNIRQRIEYIRDHKSQFEFHDMTDLIGCVRGKYFAGYASELLS